MNDIFIDTSCQSLIKYGEELCGDMVQRVKDENSVIIVLADGMGSGVKANILATLTSKIISTMVAEKMSIEDCVSTISATLPVCKERNAAYSTFTIIKITDGRFANIIQYDNPRTIVLRHGKNFEYPYETHSIGGKEIIEAGFEIENDDVFIAMSDGVTFAGNEMILNYGWQRENIIEYMEGRYNYKLTAKELCSMIIDSCSELYEKKPSDDATAAVIQIRKRKRVNLLFGPPEHPADAEQMMGQFFAEEGRHIVCGGTTAHIAADYLGVSVEPCMEERDDEIPPTSKMEGVDLVTEGVITMSRVLRYVRDFTHENKLYTVWGRKKDGASQIARYLLEEATDVCIYVGCAMNKAHNTTALPTELNVKVRIVKEIENELKLLDKSVRVRYF
ncbi:MAG: SpoIIE family protein phosphatase [Clostridiales bacterium]|nr:SpoIIE family protein phosphatase [Clostridiales bacterium]